jgi:G:T-mismatch repair DNA endonuclease (very short patch repair protein)
LKKLGWQVLTVWQCELKDQSKLAERLDEFLAE